MTNATVVSGSSSLAARDLDALEVRPPAKIGLPCIDQMMSGIGSRRYDVGLGIALDLERYDATAAKLAVNGKQSKVADPFDLKSPISGTSVRIWLIS